MKTTLKLISDFCGDAIYCVNIAEEYKSTCNVNGKDVPHWYLTLISAKSALSIMSIGMKVRNVNLTSIRCRLAQYGIYINQNTTYDVMVSVHSILADLGYPTANNKLPKNLKDEDRKMLEAYNEPKLICNCGHPCCEYNYPKNK